MTNSLNQAFIKAYTKEQASQAARVASEAEAKQREAEAFIVRFDTATCSIPEPHVLASKQRRSESVAAASAPKPQAVRLATAAPHIVRQQKDELRDSIASQMLKAGIWEDQQIDAFIGGFPMISSFHQPTAAQTAIANSSLPTQPERAPQGGANSHRETESTVKPTPAVDSPAGGPAQVSQPVSQSAPASIRSPLDMAGSYHDQGRPALDAPVSPALSDDAHSIPNDVHGEDDDAPTIPTADEKFSKPVLEERFARRAGSGEIFRLDRPSYSAPLAGSADDVAAELSDSGEASSILQALSSSNTHIEIDALLADMDTDKSTAEKTKNRYFHKGSGQPADHAHVREVEEGLRRARVRIFNPVWEVDSFQWPEVCLELLEQRADVMDKVAQNLISACQEGLQVLAITSPQSGEGRTTVACCLAKLAGSRGLNVAIVDGDIENPTLSFQTNLDIDQDWKTAIFNQLPLEEVSVHSIDDQVTLVPLVSPIEHTEMATDDNRIGSMLQELSESFDLVIVDMGHMNSTRSLVTTMSEQGIVSAVVAVVDHRHSNPQQIESCLRRIRQTGVASIGLVENFAA